MITALESQIREILCPQTYCTSQLSKELLILHPQSISAEISLMPMGISLWPLLLFTLFHIAQQPKITISKYGIILDKLECDNKWTDYVRAQNIRCCFPAHIEAQNISRSARRGFCSTSHVGVQTDGGSVISIWAAMFAQFKRGTAGGSPHRRFFLS